MCGIAGYLSAEKTAFPPLLLENMCQRLAHRGPDAFGQFREGPIALGHRRLSIIDLSTGDQPLGNEDGSIQVVFNGEIYNYRELRSELQSKGHKFATQSDTEVLVHLYEEVGERVPEYLNGMFAFALWDAPRETLFLARDRLGKKPLYYSSSVRGMRLCFASELKALTVVPGFSDRINPRAVADFLSLSYVPDPDTIYANTFKLPPGHGLMASRDGVRTWRYWQAEIGHDEAEKPEAALEEIRALAQDAVKRRMISDVPLGAFLSGGVDSGAVAGLMATQSTDQVKTFSIGFEDKRFDELEYARIAAKRYHTDHHEQIVSPAIEDVFDVLVNHFDEPFGDSSAIPMLYVARMARKHVTVALSGDGADELFGGYRRYAFGILEERLRNRFPAWFRKSAIKAGAQLYPKFDYLPQMFRAKTLLTNLTTDLSDSYFTSMSTFRDTGLNDVLSTGMRTGLTGYSAREKFRGLFQQVRHGSPLEQMQWVDLQTYLPGDILVKADRATMAYSLEARSPWLDYRMAELSFRLPPSLKVHRGTGKYIFKQAMSPYVSQQVIGRKKMGFSVPLAEWFRTSLKPRFQSLVRSEAMEEFVSPSEVKRIWNEHQSGIHNHDRKLWNLLMLGAWNARHRGGASAEAQQGWSLGARQAEPACSERVSL
jgi:asparagine synthase (glutamine-hydrolysing)